MVRIAIEALIRRLERDGQPAPGVAERAIALAAREEGGTRASLRLPLGVVHEWYSASGPADDWGPPLLLLSRLAARAVADGPSTGRRWVLWMGRACWLYPKALIPSRSLASGEPEGDPLAGAIFVSLPPVGRPERLWAIDLAARCRSVAAVVADGRGLGMSATRRLQVAAAEGQTLVLLARTAAERGEISAAATRWLVAPAPTERACPRWRLTLTHCKGRPPAPGMRPGRSWFWEADDDDREGSLPSGLANELAARRPARAVASPAELVDRPGAASLAPSRRA